MIALVRSELVRFRSRRLVKTLAVVASVGILVIVGAVAIRSEPGPAGFSIIGARNFLEGTSSLFAIAGWLIGASMIGAEWQAGTVTTLLAWEPRRARVLVAKVLATATGVFAMVLALDLALTGLMAVVAATRGTADGIDSTVVRALVGLDLRVAALAMFGAVLGLGLAAVTRNTAAALGISFVYLAIGESLIRSCLPGWVPWLVGDNSIAFLLANGISASGRSMWEAALVLAMWCIAFVGIATGAFLARDVD